MKSPAQADVDLRNGPRLIVFHGRIPTVLGVIAVLALRPPDHLERLIPQRAEALDLRQLRPCRVVIDRDRHHFSFARENLQADR